MEMIFLCWDEALCREVAIKFLKGIEVDPGQRELFWNDACVIALGAHRSRRQGTSKAST